MNSFIGKTLLIVFVGLSSFLNLSKNLDKHPSFPINKTSPSDKVSTKAAVGKDGFATEKQKENLSKPTLKKETKQSEKKIQNAKVISPKEEIDKSAKTKTKSAESVVVDSGAEANTFDFEKINEKVRQSVINIICLNTKSGAISPVTGSGTIISKDGVIITNAHIGQYFLLKDFNGEKDYLDCQIRTSSPAKSMYRAKLVYISPDWISNNKTILVDKNPVGTGEYDYAFLKITAKVDGTNLPDSFSYLSLNTNENIKIGTDSLLVSYPAGFLGGISILNGLYQTSAITKISELFTFNTDTIDLISVGGTVVSQKGSSGGAVTDNQGFLLGIISTSGDANITKDRDLRAVTMAYINRNLKEKTGGSLDDLVSNADSVSGAFLQDTAPALTKILTDVILGQNK